MNLLRDLDQDDRVMSGAIMTTFPFDVQFFEQTVLPALREKKIDDSVAILADSGYYNTTLEVSEESATNLGLQQYPKQAGQRYNLAPISVGPRRAFHPKIHYLTGDRRVQATITSANITHPGFTNNQEIATKVTVNPPTNNEGDGDEQPQHKAAICREVASFIDSLVNSQFGRSIDPVTRETVDEVLEAGAWINEYETPPIGERSVWFLENLETSILEQTRNLLDQHGENIRSVDIVAPFYGSSLAIPRQFTDEGIVTHLWLQQGRTQISLDDLDRWLNGSQAKAKAYESTRYVHGKLLRIRTDEAVYSLTGSPNASQAALALSATGEGGNIEAAVLRRHEDVDRFEYLFDQSPFTDAEIVDTDAFESGTFGEIAKTEDSSEERDSEVFSLFGVSYRRRDSYDGGTLIVTGQAGTEVREAIDENGVTLHVRPPVEPRDEEDQSTIRIQPHRIEWDDGTTESSFTVEREIYGKNSERPFTRTGIAQLQCGDYTTDSRWVQTRSPETGEPTAEDVAEAGATAVPRAITRLYQDDEEQVTTIESLNGLLAALKSTGDLGPDSAGTTDQETEREGPSGGLRVREWSQSGSNDPNDLLSSFFDGWKSDLDDVYSAVTSDEYYFDTVETRLTAINATVLQLLVLDDAHSNLDVPRQIALNTIKDVYSQQGFDDQLESIMADYCYVVRHYADRSEEEANKVYTGLRQQVLPQILLGALIAEAHIAGNRPTYFNQQDWAFERLINQCFADSYPSPAQFESTAIDELTTTIWDSIEGIRDRIDGSAKLRRHADQRYLEKKQLRRSVVELLGRGLLIAGPVAIKDYQSTPRQVEQLDRIFEECLPYLPSSKQDAVKQLL